MAVFIMANGKMI